MLDFLLIIVTVFGAFGGFAFKKMHFIKKILFLNHFFLIGGVLYFLSALVNIYLLKKIPYSLLFPLTSLSYIWSMLISKIFLDEKITNLKILGIIFIIFGSIILSFN